LPDLPMMREIDGGSNSAMFYLKKNEIDFASKIKTLIEDHKLRKDLSERAFDRATKSFSAERYLNDRMDFLLS